MSRVIKYVCLIVSPSASISGVACCVGMSSLGGDGSACCGEWLLLLCLIVGCAAATVILPCVTALLVSCCNCSNWRLSNSVPPLLVPLREFSQASIACISLLVCVTVGLVVFL